MVNTLSYVTIDMRLEKLKTMGLKIQSRKNAITYINEAGYNKLLDAYKWPFWDKEQKRFYPDVDICDLYQLYSYDCALKSLLLNSIFTLEMAVKVQMSEVFSQYLGMDIKDYLDDKYYRDIKTYGKTNQLSVVQYSKLKDKIYKALDNGKEHRSVKYYLTNYGQVPFWSLANILSFGEMNSLLAHLKTGYQIHIAKFWKQNHKFLVSAMGVVRMFRNACAHNETVFNFKTVGYRLNSDTIKVYLDYFKIVEVDKNNHYRKGTNDLLAIFFIFKIMLPKNKFQEFVDQYLSITKNFTKKVKSQFSSNVLSEMHVPDNIRELLNLPLIENY